MTYSQGLVVGGMVLGLLAIAQINRASADDAQKAYTLKRSVEVTLDYLLYLPPGYEGKPSWPLMLFLHGAGNGAMI